MDPIVKDYNDTVSIELLDRIRKGTPYFFEKLVVELLSALSDLMLQYQVGVNVKKQYTTFDIDEDFFIEDD